MSKSETDPLSAGAGIQPTSPLQDMLARLGRDLAAKGVALVAISSNDVANYPQDGPDEMKKEAADAGYNFAYLFDADQSVAKAYKAACTPDFFGFDAGLGLQYRGRLDESRMKPVPEARRDLFEAMKMVADTGHGPKDQIASMGCSIKWK